MDLTNFTTKELIDMQITCIDKISKMIADPQTIELCAAIEEELKKRA